MSAPRLLLHLALLALISTAALSAKKIKGIAFSTGHDLWGYRQPFTDQSFRNLKKTGAEWVHLTAYMKMPSLTAWSSWQMTPDKDIIYIIRKARNQYGFKVFFKPQVEINGFQWRGFLPGTNFWFRKLYTPFIVKMATIAQREGVEMFSIGSELKYSLPRTEEWKKVIWQVRSVYKRPITYVANHDSFKRVKFWGMLDVISISAYFQLLPGRTGGTRTLQQTKLLWRNKAKEVNQWRKNNGLAHKKILVAEFGAMAKGNGVTYRIPWEWDVQAPTSLWEQTKMYEAFLSEWMHLPWVRGVILYNWELRPDYGLKYPQIQWYTPQNKPAVKVMTKYFKKQYW